MPHVSPSLIYSTPGSFNIEFEQIWFVFELDWVKAEYELIWFIFNNIRRVFYKKKERNF